MKKILIVFALFASSFTQAQQEIRLDLGDALIMKTIEVSYEHYLSPQSSIGLSGLFNLEGESSDFRYNEDTMFTPYFRHYFTSNQTWNHFGEVFLGINTGKNKVEEEYTDGALGIVVGSKYISNGGFVVSVHGGIGRNMFSDLSPSIVPRVGINLGYRF